MNAVATSIPAPKNEWYRNYVWLIKRELWEHRGRFLVAPLVVSGIILLAVLYGVTQMGHVNFTIDSNNIRLGGGGNSIAPLKGIHFAASLGFSVPFFFMTFFITMHYVLDTLYADRRDRSILFWKSLPVSDFETVLSKLFMAAVVAPLVTFVVAVVTQYSVYVIVSLGLIAHGHGAGEIWSSINVFENLMLLLYALVAVALWYLPIWSWCLLASSWANRAVFIWAAVPIGAAWFLEYLTFGTNYIGRFLQIRFNGMIPAAFDLQAVDNRHGTPSFDSLHLTDIITPGAFFSSPQLWIGIVMAAGLIAATIWVRRYRETA